MLVRISLLSINDDCNTVHQLKVTPEQVQALQLHENQRDYISAGFIITTHVRDLKELF